MSLSGKASFLYVKDTRKCIENILAHIDSLVEEKGYATKREIPKLITSYLPTQIAAGGGSSSITNQLIVPNEQIVDTTIKPGYTWIVPDGFTINSTITLEGNLRCL